MVSISLDEEELVSHAEVILSSSISASILQFSTKRNDVTLGSSLPKAVHFVAAICDPLVWKHDPE